MSDNQLLYTASCNYRITDFKMYIILSVNSKIVLLPVGTAGF